MHAALTARLKRSKSAGCGIFRSLEFRPALIGLVMLVASISVGCGSKPCQEVWASADNASPDGKWIAAVHQYVCDSGLGASEEKDVELRLASDLESRKVIMSPRGQWTDPQKIKLNWIGASILEVTVPNRTALDSNTLKHRGVEIRVRYEDDDPADRANWLKWVEENQRWAGGSSTQVQAKPPTPR
jgi:hypothetical protein